MWGAERKGDSGSCCCNVFHDINFSALKTYYMNDLNIYIFIYIYIYIYWYTIRKRTVCRTFEMTRVYIYIYIYILIIYLLTAIWLSPGGSTHLHTNDTQNNTNNNRTTQITTNVEECGPRPVFASFTLAHVLHLRKKHGKTTVRVR
jgi:hypothetical protein